MAEQDALAERLGPSAVGAIARLCDRSLLDSPTRAELEHALYAADQPAVVRGDPSTGVVATVAGDGRAFVRLLVVDKDHRRRGLGRRLLGVAEADARAMGSKSLTTGADAPYYLWPGVDTRELGLLCLLERAKYTRVETNFNMDVDLARIPDDPGGWELAGPSDMEAVSDWAERYWSSWKAEMLHALSQRGLVISRDGHGIAAVCAFDVNRAGLVGPVASRHELVGAGVGTPPLLGALHTMRAAGRDRAEICWVGPLVPYARVGATIGRTFFVYRKNLDQR